MGLRWKRKIMVILIYKMDMETSAILAEMSYDIGREKNIQQGIKKVNGYLTQENIPFRVIYEFTKNYSIFFLIFNFL